MNWDQARKLFALSRRHDALEGRDVAPHGADELRVVRARSLCIASGKGGTGKSVVAAALAELFARGARTLVLDADMGVGNAHILHDLCPEHSLVDVVEGRCSVREVVLSARPGLDLLAAGSGVSRMAGLTSYELHLVASGLEALESDYERVLVDSAAGISTQTVSFAAASDAVLIVTTPDVTALTDAYAFLKVLLQRRPDCAPSFVVNRATSAEEGLAVAERLRAVSRKFLGREPRFLGAIPEDRTLALSVAARQPVTAFAPDAPSAQALVALARELRHELEGLTPRGLGRQLLRTIASTPKIA